MFSFAGAIKQSPNKKKRLLQTYACQPWIAKLTTLENLMSLAKHLPKNSPRVLRVIPLLDITQNVVKGLPERQRIRSNVGRIRYNAGLPEWIAYVRILAGPQDVLVLAHPGNDHTGSETSRVPLGFFIFASLKTKTVQFRVGNFAQKLRRQAIGKGNCFRLQQFANARTNLGAYFLRICPVVLITDFLPYFVQYPSGAFTVRSSHYCRKPDRNSSTTIPF